MTRTRSYTVVEYGIRRLDGSVESLGSSTTPPPKAPVGLRWLDRLLHEDNPLMRREVTGFDPTFDGGWFDGARIRDKRSAKLGLPSSVEYASEWEVVPR